MLASTEVYASLHAVLVKVMAKLVSPTCGGVAEKDCPTSCCIHVGQNAWQEWDVVVAAH